MMGLTRRCAFLLLSQLVVAGVTLANEPSVATADADRNRCTIGIEYQLRIVVWGEPEPSLEVAVRPDGKITIPPVRDVEVNGLTPEEVRSAITEKLSGFVGDPGVTVIGHKINKVFFVGDLNNPESCSFSARCPGS